MRTTGISGGTVPGCSRREKIMKRAVRTMLLAAGAASILVVSLSAPVAAQQKYAYIRPQYVLEKYDPYVKAMDKVSAFEKAETDKLKQRMDEFQKKVEAAQKQAQLMNEDQIAQKRKELETEQTKIQKSQEDLLDRENGSLVRKHRDLIQPIINQFNVILKQVGEREGYDFILNANPDDQIMLYGNPKFDISDVVLEELNKVAEAEAAAAPAAPSTPAAAPAPSKTPAKTPAKK